MAIKECACSIPKSFHTTYYKIFRMLLRGYLLYYLLSRWILNNNNYSSVIYLKKFVRFTETASSIKFDILANFLNGCFLDYGISTEEEFKAIIVPFV